MQQDTHELLRRIHDRFDLFLFEVVRAQESWIDVGGGGEELWVLDGPSKDDMAQALGKVLKEDLVELPVPRKRQSTESVSQQVTARGLSDEEADSRGTAQRSVPCCAPS